jgi:hypothetical protein
MIYIEQIDNTQDIEKETDELLNQYEELNNLGVKHLLKKFVVTYTIDEKE